MKKLTNTITLLFGLILIQTNTSFANDITTENDPTEEVDQCTVKGLFYTVQLGVFSKPLTDETFPEAARPVYCLKRQDGLYVYFAGVFDNRFDAMAKRYDIVKTGLYESYVAVYYNGEQVSMAYADDLLNKEGDDILYNSDKSEFYTQKSE